MWCYSTMTLTTTNRHYELHEYKGTNPNGLKAMRAGDVVDGTGLTGKPPSYEYKALWGSGYSEQGHTQVLKEGERAN